MINWSGLRSVALSAASILAGSVEPARSIASQRTKNPCIWRAAVSSRSSPLRFLYISLIRKVGDPAGPTLKDDRLGTPCASLPTVLTSEESEKPALSAIIIGGL